MYMTCGITFIRYSNRQKIGGQCGSWIFLQLPMPSVPITFNVMSSNWAQARHTPYIM